MTFVLLLLCVGIAASVPHLLLRYFGYRHLTYTLAFSEREVTEGDTVTLIETICSRKPLPLPWVKVELTTDASLSFAGGQGTVTGETQFLSSFFCIFPYRRIERRRTVVCNRRGMFEVSHAVVMLTDLFDSLELSRSYPEAKAAITVLPAMRHAMLPQDFPQQLTGDAVRCRALMPDRFAISGIRPYADGDSARDICWSATARSEQPMVWQYQETAAPALTVLLNCATRENDRDLVSDRALYESAIRLSAACIGTAAVKRIPVRFCANTTVGGKPVETAFCAGHTDLLRLRRLLAALPTTISGRFSRLMQRVCAEDAGMSVVIVTAQLDDEMIRLAGKAQHLTILLLRPPARPVNLPNIRLMRGV